MLVTNTKPKTGRSRATFLLLPCLIAGCSFTVPDEDSVFQNSEAGGNTNGGTTGAQSSGSVPLTNVGGAGGGSAGTTSKVISGGSDTGTETASGGMVNAAASSSTGGTEFSGSASANGGSNSTTGGATSGIGGTLASTAGSSSTAIATGGAGGTITSTAGSGGTAIMTGGAGATGGSSAGLSKLCGTATADSEQNSSRGYHPATDATDGNTTTTRWTAADAALGHYWTLDFGCEQSPEKVVIYWEYPNGNVTDPYGVMFQVSHDGQLFTNLFYVEQAGQILTLDVNALAKAASGSTPLAVSNGGSSAGDAGGTSEGGTSTVLDSGGTSAGGTGGTSEGGTSTVLDSGGTSAGGASGGGGVDTGGAGGASSGGVTASGGSTGNSPWNGSARYIRLQITKLPPPVNGRATWAGFWEVEVYTQHRNSCGVSCP